MPHLHLLLLTFITLTFTSTLTHAFVYPPPHLPSECTWYTSRFCTNVNWPVPVAQVTSLLYDQTVQDDILSRLEYTSSRTCRHWITDFLCRSSFTYCSADTGGGAGPCRNECELLSEKCPMFNLQCNTYTNNPKACMTRSQLGLDAHLTVKDVPFNTNHANTRMSGMSVNGGVSGYAVLIMTILLAISLAWTW